MLTFNITYMRHSLQVIPGEQGEQTVVHPGYDCLTAVGAYQIKQSCDKRQQIAVRGYVFCNLNVGKITLE